jgi:phosphatidylserine/phosphatidylglycerophosphate/cardiolipin synthase-like enzyme
LRRYPSTEIRYNPNIHAKLYICWGREAEDSFALFGSGNLTVGGLKQNIELGMMILSRGYGKKLIRDLYHWGAHDLRINPNSRLIKPYQAL